MYVCNCNGITEKDVAQAIENGCADAEDIYEKCGSQPQCGRCIDRMRSKLAEFKQPLTPADMLAAE
jgi:bacterioferritin-associated ferredoxin